MRSSIAIILALGGILACNEPKNASHGPVAFIVYDAGETLAMLPVADRLETSGLQVRWYPLTPWAADLLTAHGQSIVPLPDDMADMPHLEDRQGNPDTGYWEKALGEDPPGLAVLGMVSRVQGRLGAWMRERGIPTRGLYDGFQPPTESSPAIGVAAEVDEIWVPTQRVRVGFAELGLKSVVVGQPTLESWRRGAEEVSVAVVRETQGLGPHDRVLLFAGQYGDGYDETLASFLRAVNESLVVDPSLVLVLSHHPRTDGSVERRALEESGLERAMMMSESLSTMEMAVASEVVLTWTSTVATQAAFMGKQVVYYSPPEGFDTTLVSVGAAGLAREGNLARVLAYALANPRGPEEIRRALLGAGYVVDADLVVAERVLMGLEENR